LQGDWKIAGLGLTIPLVASDGSPTRWEYVQYDSRSPGYIQRSIDYLGMASFCFPAFAAAHYYLAPEFAPDKPVSTSSDLYSLGCVVYAVHCKGNPPFKHHGSMSSLRDVAGKRIGGMEMLDNDLKS
jgi:SCY1-like protein 2